MNPLVYMLPCMNPLVYILHTYRFGIIEREMGMKTKAREKQVKACHLYPLLWAAWEELYKLCTDRDMVRTYISVY